MEKLIKLFPLLPDVKDTTKLILSIVFYVLVPGIAIPVTIIILALTVILAPLVPVVPFVASAYSIMGIIFTIMKYLGKEI